jgi:hypothetical protein
MTTTATSGTFQSVSDPSFKSSASSRNGKAYSAATRTIG